MTNMAKGTTESVLIVGGSGVVGSRTARTLRALYPDLPIAIGGRDLAKAAAVAEQVGRARPVRVDLERPDLGQPAGEAYGAVLMFVKDERMNALRFAQETGAAYVDISTVAFELAPEIALHAQRPRSAPVLLASHWLAGSATLPTLHFAKGYARVESVAIGVVLDEQDVGGPAAYADFERQTRAGMNGLLLKDGRWIWVGGEEGSRSFVTVDGTEVKGQIYPVLDPMSIAAATDARSIRFDLVLGETASRRRGEPFSTEIVIELEGVKKDGARGRSRHELVHPEGQAPMTAVGVAVAVERLLGLTGGERVAPGLYHPNALIDPEHMLDRLAAFGTRIRSA
ncbi:saccharopine dehydrogenase NADP-binding domain-containing protein [Sorangium sp. So ce861]|uniref:saccharopine dehydrogenase NADP-binding domain-containing protein n=1 Tax=Sorangium sp. So ce861 TaxID=3133323 RepID=UPI003F6427B3